VQLGIGELVALRHARIIGAWLSRTPSPAA
jgi:hypothetical protein